MPARPKIIALVGHCGPDNSYLRMVISSADQDAEVLSADDEAELNHLLQGPVDLVLLNRELGWGFNDMMGVDLIRHLRPQHPQLKMMLVSNYPEAQADAVEAGAVPGFGKREIGSRRVIQLLRDALSPT